MLAGRCHLLRLAGRCHLLRFPGQCLPHWRPGRFLPPRWSATSCQPPGGQDGAGTRFVTTMTALQNLMVARCMNHYNFGPRAQPYIRYDELYVNQASPMVPGWGGENESGVPNLYDLGPLAHGGLLGEIETGSPNPPSLPAAEAREIDADYQRCQIAATQSFRKLNETGFSLGDLWRRQVIAIQSAPQVQVAAGEFGGCVAGHGAPVEAAKSPDAFSWWLSNLVQPSVDPAAVKSPIAVRVAVDRHWTQVFVTCAGPVLALEGRLQLQQQKAFFAAHGQQVLAIEDLASRVLSRLERQYGTGSAG